MEELLLPIGMYRHYKGDLYNVRGIATHSETEEQLVVYGPADSEEMWVRPLDMFKEDVETDEGLLPRFSFIGSA